MLHDPHWQTRQAARQILTDATGYLENHPWCQGAMRCGPAVCLLGAIDAVCPNGSDFMVNAEIIRRLRKVTKGWGVPQWNDANGRTKQQVIAALRKAAAL